MYGAPTAPAAPAGAGTAAGAPAAAPAPGAPMLLTQLGVGRPRGTALIGAEGIEFVAGLLLTKGPNHAVAELQASYGLRHPLCRPLLCMIDYLQIPRREAHLFVLNRARRLLLEWIAGARAAAAAAARGAGGGAAGAAGGGGDAPGAGAGASGAAADAAESPQEAALQERLERLLNASFKYMGVPELRQVPMEVMSSMTHVPAPYLKLLAEDREIFNGLPAAVKQQVYEYDRNLLQQDAVQFIAAYKYELGTTMAALSMAPFVRERPRLCGGGARGGGGGGGGRGSGGGGPGGAAGGAPLPKGAEGRRRLQRRCAVARRRAGAAPAPAPAAASA